MEVKAAVAHEANKPLQIETVELEGPRTGEVLVEIKATGVCHTDEFTLSGADPEGLFPAVLGTRAPGWSSRWGLMYATWRKATTSSHSIRRSVGSASPAYLGRPTCAPRYAPPRAVA